MHSPYSIIRAGKKKIKCDGRRINYPKKVFTDENVVEKVDVNVDVNECGEMEKDEEAESKRESVVDTETNKLPILVVYAVEAEFDFEFESDVEKALLRGPG